jgi:glucosamine--fructose-6-phosphate aminotransferase (isomerizing)
MCGIVGYVGPDQALPILLDGLRRLEYRGYDSAGVAVLDGAIRVVKRAGKLSELEAVLADGEPPPGQTGVGHTRWGPPRGPPPQKTHRPPTVARPIKTPTPISTARAASR